MDLLPTSATLNTSPPPFSLSHSASQGFPTTPTTGTRHRPRPPSHRCLDLPEVLTMILGFLDDDTVCRVTPLVSRFWLRLSRVIKPIRVVVVWHSSWSSDLLDMKLLALQDNAMYFRCFITDRDIENQYKGVMLNWAMINLQTKIREQELAAYSDDQNNNTRNLFKTRRDGQPFGTLRSLYLHFGPQALAAVNTFPFPSSLNKLSIIGVRSRLPTELNSIVDRCPFLEELYIEGHASSWRSACLSWNKHGERSLGRLRALTLKSIHILCIDFEYLCSISPTLTDVKLVGVSTDPDRESQEGLYNTLKTLQMAFRSASLLPLSGVMQPRKLKQWLARSWHAWLDLSLHAPSTTLSLLREAVHCPSLLTSLEIAPHRRIGLVFPRLGSSPAQSLVYRRLHIFLCTSPRLVHLQHLRTAIILEDIDLFGRRGFVDVDVGLDKATYPQPVGPNTHPGIWLCRRLRSLRVEVHKGMETLHTSSVHSRIIFGYISRICPYLESLEIDVPYADSGASMLEASFYPQLNMKLQGGLCLLAKLDRLRRLRISSERGRWTFDCEDYEVNWISCSPYHRMNRMFRHWTLSLWKKMKEHEKKLEQARLGAAKEEKLPEPAAKTDAETAPAAATSSTAAVPIETGPAPQHVHFAHFDPWIADMDLDDDEAEEQGMLDQVGQWNAAMNLESENEGQDVVGQPTISASDVESEEEGLEEEDVPFVPEPVPAACLPGVQYVLDDLQNLGLLRDVEVMIRWLQSDSFRPLPELKRLSLGFEMLQRPKDEMRRLFPCSIEHQSPFT